MVAGPLTTDSGFGAGSTTVMFDEVPWLATGDVVSGQFSAYGVTFDGKFRASSTSGPYCSIPNFHGRYLDNFTGGTTASVGDIYDIIFSNDVSQAGAYFEFNPGAQAATFYALLNGSVVESFSYNNDSCCNSAAFLGFSGVTFDTLRFRMGTGVGFIMDTVKFYPGAQQEVPEPAALGLLGFGLLGIGAARRREA